MSYSVWLPVAKKSEPTTVVDKNDDTYLPAKVQPVLEEWHRKTFSYFYEGADPLTGMAYEGNERGSIVTIGGSGFGVMALIVGSERGWITRQQAAERTQKIVRFLEKPNGIKECGRTGTTPMEPPPLLETEKPAMWLKVHS